MELFFSCLSDAYSASQISLDWVEGGKPIIPPKFKDMLEFTFDSHTFDREVVDYGLGDSKCWLTPIVK